MIDFRPLLPALFPIPLWLLAILVGLWNNHRGNSFWVGFLLSMFFTPLGGAFLIATTTTKKIEDRKLTIENCWEGSEENYRSSNAQESLEEGRLVLGTLAVEGENPL